MHDTQQVSGKKGPGACFDAISEPKIKTEDPSQAAHKTQQATLENLTKAAQEVAEMHELLEAHKQRIPTVDMVQLFTLQQLYKCR